MPAVKNPKDGVTTEDVAPVTAPGADTGRKPAEPYRPSFGLSERERLDRVQREALAAAEADK